MPTLRTVEELYDRLEGRLDNHPVDRGPLLDMATVLLLSIHWLQLERQESEDAIPPWVDAELARTKESLRELHTVGGEESVDAIHARLVGAHATTRRVLSALEHARRSSTFSDDAHRWAG